MWGWRAAYGAGGGATGASWRLRCTDRPRVAKKGIAAIEMVCVEHPRVAVWGIADIEMCVERPRVVKRGNAPIEIVCIERPRVAVWGIAPIGLVCVLSATVWLKAVLHP